MRDRARILEIGAGTGASTAAILPLLPAGTSYLFTDLSTLFTRRASERFAVPGFATGLLDIERDPAAQGLADQRFDVVVAANVLHATADLAATLGHARSLLAPGGALVLLEGTAPRRWIDLVFGLTEGWWRFADTELRPDYPLLAAPAWRAALAAAGFAHIEVIEPDTGRLFAQAVIVARAEAGAEPGGWLVLAPPGPLRAALAASDRVRAAAAGLDEVDLAGAGCDGVLVLAEDSLDACSALLPVVQALAALQPPPRLVVATTAATAAEGAVSAPAAASLWGMGRVVAKEHPDLRPLWLDLDPAFAPAEAARRLWDAVAAPGAEQEMARAATTAWCRA